MTVDQDPLEEFTKNYLASRTLWTSAVLPIVVALVPPVAPWIAANPVAAASIFSALMAGLRLATKRGVKLPRSKK